MAISGTTAVSLRDGSVDREKSEHSMFLVELELMGSDVARLDVRDNSELFEPVSIAVIDAFLMWCEPLKTDASQRDNREETRVSAPVVVAGGEVLMDVAGVVSTEVLRGNERVARVRTGLSGPVFKLGLDVG